MTSSNDFLFETNYSVEEPVSIGHVMRSEVTIFLFLYAK